MLWTKCTADSSGVRHSTWKLWLHGSPALPAWSTGTPAPIKRGPGTAEPCWEWGSREGSAAVGNETRAEAGATGVQQRSAPLVTEPADGIGCCGLDSEPCSRAGSRAGERADAVGSGKWGTPSYRNKETGVLGTLHTQVGRPTVPGTVAKSSGLCSTLKSICAMHCCHDSGMT